jgi:hypothetical protein
MNNWKIATVVAAAFALYFAYKHMQLKKELEPAA